MKNNKKSRNTKHQMTGGMIARRYCKKKLTRKARRNAQNLNETPIVKSCLLWELY